MISALLQKVKIRISNFFEKILKFLGFHGVVPTWEDLSIDVSITNVGLIAIDEAKVISAFRHKSKFEF